MFFSLIYYPRIEHPGFHDFRNKYEPYASLLAEHVPFIFPVEASIGQEQLEMHISNVMQSWKPFDLHFSSLAKTGDHWLFLTPDEGNEEAVRLHDELYTGIMKPFLREDLPYSVHIGLGLFAEEGYDFNDPTAELSLDAKKYDRAVAEFTALNFTHRCTVDQLVLVEVNDTFSQCRDVKSFKLNK